ncbi:MAG: hypothetical protein KAJ39_07340 [Gammaproteobacteria bacterium]|nr:hypothetical protein [Gammaproteobacteria bacterium]
MSESIDQFRERCAKAQSKINKNIDRWNLLHNGQKRYGGLYKPVYGLLTRSRLCPHCNKKLKLDFEYGDSKYFYTLLTCVCGYEYSMKQSKQSMEEID